MLRRASLLVLLPLSTVLAASAVQDSPNEKDKKALQGKWEWVSMTVGGKNIKFDKRRFFVFQNDVVRSVEANKEKKSGTFSVDASKQPKALDMSPDVKGLTILWIYELNGDDLKLCGSKDKRPTEFSSTEKDMQALIVLKRAKN